MDPPETLDGEKIKERSALEQKQRALERKVRKAKRLVAGSFDSEQIRQSKKKLREAQKELREFVEAHSDILRRDYSREKVYSDNFINNTVESGISHKHSERTSKNTVDLDYINSEQYKNKFKGITENAKVDNQIYNQAKAQLIHRNGSDKEDLCLINSTTGEIVGRQTSSKSDFGVEYNEKLKKAISNNEPYTLISVHNHPTNNPPTGDDIISNGAHKYKFGIVVAHNGKVYKYKAGQLPFSTKIFANTVDKYRGMPYNYSEEKAIAKTLDDFIIIYGIEWSELI